MVLSRLKNLVRSGARASRLASAVALIATALGGAALARGPGGNGGGAAPEIDAGSAMSALTLLTGGILLITDRIRRRRPTR